MSFLFLFTEKTEVFLEVFGNGEIRSQTEETLRCAASQLSLSVTEALETPTHPCLNTTLLKVDKLAHYLCFFKTRTSDIEACSLKSILKPFHSTYWTKHSFMNSLEVSYFHNQHLFFCSSRREMSWPGYSSCGCSLSLHCLSQCPKPGIIGSGSTSEHVTTPRWAASIGTLQ